MVSYVKHDVYIISIQEKIASFYVYCSMEESLLPLMISDYITSVYSLTIFDHDSDCSVCRQVRDKAEYILSSLKTMAESGFGRGEIAHILLRSKDQTKKEKIALSIPYIIG